MKADNKYLLQRILIKSNQIVHQILHAISWLTLWCDVIQPLTGCDGSTKHHRELSGFRLVTVQITTVEQVVKRAAVEPLLR